MVGFFFSEFAAALEIIQKETTKNHTFDINCNTTFSDILPFLEYFVAVKILRTFYQI